MIPIIFFVMISIFLCLLFFLKIKVTIFFQVNNLDFQYQIRILSKRIHKRYRLQEQKNHQNQIKKVQVSKTKEKQKINIQNILNLIQIQNIKVSAYIGLLFMTPTIVGVTLLNTFIPILYHYFSREGSRLSYQVSPVYDTFRVDISGEIHILITPIKFFQLVLILRKRNSK